MTWAAHLVRIMDGQVGARLELAGQGAWTIPLNGIEEFTVTVGKEQLRAMEPDWWHYMKTGVVVSWVRPDGSSVPWIAGPIVGPPTNESRSTATLECRGLGAVLEKRVVLARDYGLRDEYRGDTVHLANSRVRREGMSLGTIGQDIVELCTSRKLGGFLPIRYASPRETGPTLNERTYEGFNLSNNGLWKRLTELSRVRNGPDFAFRPEWIDNGRRLQWAMFHGTRAQPTIAQEWTMDVDTTSALSPVADVSVSTDASNVTQRVYWTGAGEGPGTLVRLVQNENALRDYMPLLETVGSTSDSENLSLLVEHARATLHAGRTHVTQITVLVDGSDQRTEIGRWRVGDAARLTLGDEWLTVRAGTTTKRIISAKGTWSNAMINIEFQDDAVPSYEDEEDFN